MEVLVMTKRMIQEEIENEHNTKDRTRSGFCKIFTLRRNLMLMTLIHQIEHSGLLAFPLDFLWL